MTCSIRRLVPRRWIFAALMISVLIAGIAAAGDKDRSIVNCDLQTGGCTRWIGNHAVRLDVMPKPVRAMEELTFRVILEPLAGHGQPYIDLNMPAMDMGRNRVALKKSDDGAFKGQGVMVRCRSGLRTWRARVTFPGIGSADFIFDVIY